MAKIEKNVENLLEKTINDLGYELYDVEYVREGKDYFLRIYIDNTKGITLEDCEKVSDGITGILDEEDIIKEQYFLEVSSPGVERILKKDKHLKNNIGKEIQLKLFNNIKGSKILKGKLLNFNQNEIILAIDENNNLNVERKNIAQIKTIFNW